MAYRIDKTMQIADPFALLGGEGVIEEHLRVDIPATADPVPAERTYFAQLTRTAIRHVADLTGRNPVAATYRVHVPVLPLRLELPFRAQEITSVEYLKQGATTYTIISRLDFGIHGDTAPAVLFSRDSVTEPSDVDDDHPFPYKFTIAGLADRERTTDPVAAVEDDPATGGVDESEADRLAREEHIIATFAHQKEQHAHAKDISVRDVTISFHGANLIENTDFALNYGNRYGFIGPNGSG